MPTECLERRTHYESEARMRILSANGALVMIMSIRIRSDNANLECHRVRGIKNCLRIHNEKANLECQRGALNAELTTDPQRECDFGVPLRIHSGVPARRLECRTHYGSTARMRILECQRGAWNVEFSTGPQRGCEFGMLTERLERRIHYRSAAIMRTL